MTTPRRHRLDRGQSELLTVAEVAQTARVSRMTVYRLLHCGELAAVRVGRSFRVPRDTVERYLREHTTGRYTE